MLQFPSIIELVQFSMCVDLTNCKIDRAQATLQSDFSEAQIELAINGYGANVVAQAINT